MCKFLSLCSSSPSLPLFLPHSYSLLGSILARKKRLFFSVQSWLPASSCPSSLRSDERMQRGPLKLGSCPLTCTRSACRRVAAGDIRKSRKQDSLGLIESLCPWQWCAARGCIQRLLNNGNKVYDTDGRITTIPCPFIFNWENHYHCFVIRKETKFCFNNISKSRLSSLNDVRKRKDGKTILFRGFLFRYHEMKTANTALGNSRSRGSEILYQFPDFLSVFRRWCHLTMLRKNSNVMSLREFLFRYFETRSIWSCNLTIKK